MTAFAALDYAARGWTTLPLHAMAAGQSGPARCSCGAPKCSSPGKHPRTSRGLKDATTDSGQVVEWWQRWPAANVGLRTGAAPEGSGLVVVDVDPRHGGEDALAVLISENGELPETVEAVTGGGGRHLLFKHPGGKINNRANVRPGIDVRGDGGYIVAPPSNHASGRCYAWRDGHAPGDLPVAPMPLWMLDLIRAPKGEAPTRPARRPLDATGEDDLLTAARRYAERVPAVAEGQRNAKAFALAGQLAAFVTDAGEGLPEGRVLELTDEWNRGNTPPLDDAELRLVVRSAMHNGTARVPHIVGARHGGEQPARVLDPAAPRPDGDDQPPTRLRTACLADVEPVAVSWLWPDRVPLGYVSVFAGLQGVGKSFFALDMASRVSTGTPWPDRPDEPIAAGSVVLLSLEDGLEDVIRPRLDAAGADVRKIHAIEGVEESDRSGVGIFNIERHTHLLEEEVERLGDVRLVIVDPLSAFIGARVDAHRDNEVRIVLGALGALARRHAIAIIGIMHLRKAATDQAIFRVLGSVAFTAYARAVWLIAEDRDNPDDRLVLSGKMNLAKPAPGMRYSIIDGRIAWSSETVETTADEALAARNEGPDESGPKVREAVKWLEAALAAGPQRAKDIKKQARENCISDRTLERAKRDLGVEAFNEGLIRGIWFWRLPGEVEP